MIKDILVHLSRGKSPDVATNFGVSVAARMGAHLTGIAFRYEPLIPITMDSYEMPPEVIETQRGEIEKTVRAAAARFDDAVRLSAVEGEAFTIDASVDDAPGMLASIARRFDLSVIAQPQPHQSTLGRLFLEAVLFESGRPMLVVPYIQTSGLKLDRVMVCWDGSRSAARAVGDAMPFLIQAKAAEIVTVSGEPTKSDELPGADIAHHIARHGAKVEVERIPSTDVDIANTILSHAADTSTDLLVMGGYGHSRLREFILGGATRGILASMTVPTILSH